MSASEPSLSFSAFVRQVLDALEAAHVTYLIGDAVALAAWGETRTTRDLDLVIDLPVESTGALSLELEKRHMLVPVDICQLAVHHSGRTHQTQVAISVN